MDLKENNILGKSIGKHWYYQSKAKALKKFIKNITSTKVLDVGAGSGFFSKELMKIPSVKEVWCVDTSYEEERDDIENNKKIHFRKSIEWCDADLILLMDVLEHVDDDVGFLKTYINKVPKGVYFLISVPAFQFLWSSHDVFLEHKRRYRLKEIENILQASNLKIIQSSYYFSLVFPIAAVVRLAEKLRGQALDKGASQLKLHHPLINTVLLKICNLELTFFRHNKLFGLSAFCLAIKN